MRSQSLKLTWPLQPWRGSISSLAWGSAVWMSLEFVSVIRPDLKSGKLFGSGLENETIPLQRCHEWRICFTKPPSSVKCDR